MNLRKERGLHGLGEIITSKLVNWLTGSFLQLKIKNSKVKVLKRKVAELSRTPLWPLSYFEFFVSKS